MLEGDERQQAPQTGDESASETTDQAAAGQGPSPEQGAQSITSDDQIAGQTQTPGSDEDVGVPEQVEDRTE